MAAFVDSTEQRWAQAEADEARRTLEALMDYIGETITIADAPDVTIRHVSRYGQDLPLGPTSHAPNITAIAPPGAAFEKQTRG